MTRIWTLRELKKAVTKRWAVTCPTSHPFRGPIPAAFVINLQGATILRLFDMGMYVYEKKEK
jgi:hypothetical protein